MQGSTDSETIFALFADIYSSLKGESSAEKMATAVLATIDSIESLLQSTGHTAGCDLNLVVSDGRSAVVSRYSTEGTTPNSLYVHTGHRYSCEAGNTKLLHPGIACIRQLNGSSGASCRMQAMPGCKAQRIVKRFLLCSQIFTLPSRVSLQQKKWQQQYWPP